MLEDKEVTHLRTDTEVHSHLIEPQVQDSPELPDDDTIDDILKAQSNDAEKFATDFIKKVLRLRGVQIDRDQFLRSELHKRGYATTQIETALVENPAFAEIPLDVLDEMASSAIDFETRKSTALSFAAGIPGGLAMVGTVPADITQFYVHAFRVMQKLAYLYGWQSFLNDLDEIDDETLGKLTAFLGVMMGVAGASSSVTAFAVQVARPAVQKKVAAVALTKTAWYPVMKKTLAIVGVQVTKQSFAKAVTTVVPVVGGFVSGGLTFVALSTQASRLSTHLRSLPPPGVDAEQYSEIVRSMNDFKLEKAGSFSQGLEKAKHSVKQATLAGVNKFRSVDLDGDGIPDEPAAIAGVKKVGKNLVNRTSRNAPEITQ